MVQSIVIFKTLPNNIVMYKYMNTRLILTKIPPVFYFILILEKCRGWAGSRLNTRDAGVGNVDKTDSIHIMNFVSSLFFTVATHVKISFTAVIRKLASLIQSVDK